jgi:NAD(P)-dependent dehydrogenase (short-subunit alcohol dehydrogenase family)
MEKNILVTGAYGNLGQAVVKAFLAQGYHVWGTAAPGEKIPEGFPHVGVEVRTVDLLDDRATATLVEEWAATGPIDAAVMTVGGFAMGDIASTTSSDLMQQFRLNVETLYHTARPVYLEMKKQGHGRLFMIGSRPGSDMKLSKGNVAYGFAKSLVFRLAEMINVESAGTDIVASVLVPSIIDTPQNRKSMPDADPSAWVKAEDIASVILFHCSPAAAALREPVIRMYGRS